MKSKKNKIKLLLIEDEKALVEIYSYYFNKQACEVVSETSIDKALRLTEELKPDIVFLDIIIPKPGNTVAEQGWEYLEKVKQNKKTKDIPIVVFTNLTSEKDRERCRVMGASAYIFKRDTTPMEAWDVVQKILGLSK